MKDNIDVEIHVARDQAGTPTGGSVAIVRDLKGGRAWTGEGPTDNAAATEAVRKFLGHRTAREYVGR